MAARTRTRLTPIPGGGYAVRYIDGSLAAERHQTENSAFPAIYRQCVDRVNERTSDNPLTILFESRNWIPLNGTFKSNPTSEQTYRDYFPAITYTARTHPSGLLSSIPSVGTVATAVLARSNPSRPDISLPNFLYELKDLPEMIRDIGRLRTIWKNRRDRNFKIHPKVAASHYLSYQMGWSPLLADLRKLLDFQANVDKKLRELEQLNNNGGIQRRVRSDQWKATLTTQSSATFDSVLGSLLEGRIEGFHTVERWGTVRWSPIRPDARYSSQELAKLARDLSFGIKGISAKQVWDAIPWTWLISWFTNVDEFLQAHDNRIPLVHSVPCIMTHRFSRYDFKRTTGGILSYRGGTGAHLIDTKERVTSAGSLSASIPFLNGRQLSILSALHIQRRR